MTTMPSTHKIMSKSEETAKCWRIFAWRFNVSGFHSLFSDVLIIIETEWNAQNETNAQLVNKYLGNFCKLTISWPLHGPKMTCLQMPGGSNKYRSSRLQHYLIICALACWWLSRLAKMGHSGKHMYQHHWGNWMLSPPAPPPPKIPSLIFPFPIS